MEHRVSIVIGLKKDGSCDEPIFSKFEVGVCSVRRIYCCVLRTVAAGIPVPVAFVQDFSHRYLVSPPQAHPPMTHDLSASTATR